MCEVLGEEGNKYIFNCHECGKEFSRYKSTYAKGLPKHIFCGRICANKGREYLYPFSEDRKEAYSKLFSGEDNPNYNTKWSDEQIQNLSEKCKERYKDEEYYNKFCESNSNRIWTEEGKASLSEAVRLRMTGKTKPKMSDETKSKIGASSKARWENQEYRDNYHNKMVEAGHHRRPEDIDEYDKYFKESNWIEEMFNRVINEEQLSLLRDKGVFNIKTNTKGVVRDHIIGRRVGFSSGVPAYILRHPCNCEIITHADNVRKSFKSEEGMGTEVLYELIINYSLEWKEQNLCINYIRSTSWYEEAYPNTK